MKDAESHQELLLRYLDGNLLSEEEAQVTDLLCRDPEARAFLREVAEQAVTVADVERVEERQRRELEARQDWAGNRREALSRIGIGNCGMRAMHTIGNPPRTVTL